MSRAEEGEGMEGEKGEENEVRCKINKLKRHLSSLISTYFSTILGSPKSLNTRGQYSLAFITRNSESHLFSVFGLKKKKALSR